MIFPSCEVFNYDEVKHLGPRCWNRKDTFLTVSSRFSVTFSVRPLPGNVLKRWWLLGSEHNASDCSFYYCDLAWNRTQHFPLAEAAWLFGTLRLIFSGKLWGFNFMCTTSRIFQTLRPFCSQTSLLHTCIQRIITWSKRSSCTVFWLNGIH